MDRLDRISFLAIAALTIWAIVLIAVMEEKPSAHQPLEKLALRVDPEFDKKVGLAKTLLAGNNVEQAEALLGEMVKAYPYEATPYFLLGDLRLYRQDSVGAMLEYRQAVDLNPDLLDKKSKSFQGKKIKKTVEEARAVIEPGLAVQPDDDALLSARKVYYYMLRKIAGSCG